MKSLSSPTAPPRIPPPPVAIEPPASPKRWIRLAACFASLVKMVPLVVSAGLIWFGTADVAAQWGYLQGVVWLGSLAALVVLAGGLVTLTVQLVASAVAGMRKLSIITAVFAAIDVPVAFSVRDILLSDPSWWSVVFCTGVVLQLTAFIGISHQAAAAPREAAPRECAQSGMTI